MTDFKDIQRVCENSRELSDLLIGDFLLPYCDRKEGCSKRFIKELRTYNHVINEMPEEWPLILISQYIAHRLFRKGGYGAKYINRPEIISRGPDQLAYMMEQVAAPWRFRFCRVIGNPSPRFYTMIDVLTEETFLLYSPGLVDINKLGGQPLLFFLTSFNGRCWETYGTLVYMKGLQDFDLLFYARMLNPKCNSNADIMRMIDLNPLPFMMLFSQSEIPPVYSKKHLMALCKSDCVVKAFDPDSLSNRFFITKKNQMVRLELKRWADPPHIAQAIYNRKTNRIILTSSTFAAYKKLAEVLWNSGLSVPAVPEEMVTPVMLNAVSKILNKKPDMNPWEDIFIEKLSPSEQAHMDRVNKFLNIFIELHNSGKTPDIPQLAEQACIDPGEAEDLAKHILQRIEKMTK